jgi:CheY-like chemotaxis protein
MRSNPTALFIDSQTNFNIVQPMLAKILDEPRVIHCTTHKEAMDYIHSEEYADIIFADWDLTGYRFMDSVRSDPENHNTPVIIMSEDTTIQTIVLNKINREATFFLPKPFLEKGLTVTFSQVLKGIERRRKDRINPPSELFLKIQLDSVREYTFPLVNISLDGCLFRVPVEASHDIRIYEPVLVYLSIEEFDVQVHGEIYRIGPDLTYPEIKETVLIMVMFNALAQETREVLELIDDLGKRW